MTTRNVTCSELEELIDKGWVEAEREEIEPPICRWKVGDVSLRLSPDNWVVRDETDEREGHVIRRRSRGSSTVTKYQIGELVVETNVDYAPREIPYRIRVRSDH